MFELESERILPKKTMKTSPGRPRRFCASEFPQSYRHPAVQIYTQCVPYGLPARRAPACSDSGHRPLETSRPDPPPPGTFLARPRTVSSGMSPVEGYLAALHERFKNDEIAADEFEQERDLLLGQLRVD